MKKIIAGVLALTLVSGFVPFNNNITDKYTVYAQNEITKEAEYTTGTYGILNYKNYGDYIEISGCDASADKVEIPSEIDGIIVTSIANYAFYGCNALTSVTIPDSVTSIGDSAFASCYKLTSITIPDSVKSINHNAFESCDALISVTIENPKCEIFNSSYTISNTNGDFSGTIYGYENSTAQAYAEKYDRKFVSLEDAPVEKPTLPLSDVNADGEFSIADAVVLQKWILGIGELNNWQAGDVCTDGII